MHVPAANSHRLFVTDNDFPVSSSPSLSNIGSGSLCGIVSIVDSESPLPSLLVNPSLYLVPID